MSRPIQICDLQGVVVGFMFWSRCCAIPVDVFALFSLWPIRLGAQGAVFKSVVFEHDPIRAWGHLSFNHVPTLALLEPGTALANGEVLPERVMVVAAYGGMEEAEGDNIIWFSGSVDNGATWSLPDTVTAIEEVRGDSSAMDPKLFFHNGRIWLMYIWKPTRGAGSNGPVMYVAIRNSVDAGITWSEPRLIDVGEIQDGTFRQVTPFSFVQFGNGELGFPFYYRWVGNRTAHFAFMRSDAQLQDFNVKLFPEISLRHPDKLVEPVAFTENDRMFVYFRSTTGEIEYITSVDEGQTWSSLSGTGIPNPSTKFDIVDVGDKIFLATNNSFRARDNLMVAWGGHGAFQSLAYFATRADDIEQVSYPSMQIDNENNIHIVYSRISRGADQRRFGDILYARVWPAAFQEIVDAPGRFRRIGGFTAERLTSQESRPLQWATEDCCSLAGTVGLLGKKGRRRTPPALCLTSIC